VTLDLRPFEDAMKRLDDATSGRGVARGLLSAGQRLAETWRREVVAAGLVRTGAYRDSIRAELEQADDDEAGVRVLTDLGYPNVLEHGSPTLRARPVARTAFEREADRIVEEVSQDIASAIR
jgi:hypothetical protein